MSNFIAPATGTAFRSDTVSGVEVTVNKIAYGTSGSATDVTSTTPFPVADDVIAPARNVYTITASDATAVSPLPRAVRVNVGGTFIFRTVDGISDVTITALAGELLNARIQYLRATGTTATGFTGFA